MTTLARLAALPRPATSCERAHSHSMGPSEPFRAVHPARTVAAAPLASSSSALPTSTAPTSTATPRARPQSASTASAPSSKRPRQRQDNPRLDGSWLPVLASRSPAPGQRGCGHFVYGSPAPSTKIAAFGESRSHIFKGTSARRRRLGLVTLSLVLLSLELTSLPPLQTSTAPSSAPRAEGASRRARSTGSSAGPRSCPGYERPTATGASRPLRP